MPTTSEERLEALEKEVKQLGIKLETLVNFLNVSHLGPPKGREPYDAMVKKALEDENLQ